MRLLLIGAMALGSGCGLQEYENRVDATTRAHRAQDQERRQQADKPADAQPPAGAAGEAPADEQPPAS